MKDKIHIVFLSVAVASLSDANLSNAILLRLREVSVTVLGGKCVRGDKGVSNK